MALGNAVVTINKFSSTRDNSVLEMYTTWEYIKQYFLTEHINVREKSDVPLFNLVKYKDVNDLNANLYTYDSQTFSKCALRVKDNILQVEALVIDYDGGLPIADAIERFKDYEYVGYTSYSHRLDPKVDKYRLIFQLLRPIPAQYCKDSKNTSTTLNEYYQLIDSLKEFAGPCDQIIQNPNQIYYIPACPVSRLRFAKRWHNPGKPLNWTQFKRSNSSQYFIDTKIDPTSKPVRSSQQHLLPEQVIQTGIGNIRVMDVQGRIHGVVCPFHNDKNGTEFLNRSPKGNIYLYCKRCGKSFYMDSSSISVPGSQHLLPSVEDDIARDQYLRTLYGIPPAKKKRGKKFKLLTTELRRQLEETFGTIEVNSYLEPDRQRIQMQLDKIMVDISKPADHDYFGKPIYESHVLYMPEGAGKSQLALKLLLESSCNIIFACQSWEQVFEKNKEFRKNLDDAKADIKIAYGIDGYIRDMFNVKTIRKPSNNPFLPGELLIEETIKSICEAHPKVSEKYIRLYVALMKPPQTDQFMALTNIGDMPEDIHGNTEPIRTYYKYPTHDDDDSTVQSKRRMIITTYAQLRLVNVLHDFIPREWIIWIDDPSIEDVIDISPLKSNKKIFEGNYELEERISDGNYSLADLKEIIDGRTSRVKVVNKRYYHWRDRNKSLGVIFSKYKCIYTTTELITKSAIIKMVKKHAPQFVVHNNMELLMGSEITILGTEMVRRKHDALIPLIARRLEKKGYNLILIANGVASRYNHSNSKGQNALSASDLLVEVSIPHPDRVNTIYDALELDTAERSILPLNIMLDQLHQAIGRNSGYRWEGKECVVLVDKQKHAKIVSSCRYQVNKDTSVIIDHTQRMASKSTRLPESVSPFVREIDSLLNGVRKYITDGKVIQHDIRHVVKAIKNNSQRLLYIARLLVAITSESGWKFDSKKEVHRNNNAFTQQCKELGEWVLTEFVPDNSKDYVLKCYSEILTDFDAGRTQKTRRKHPH